MDADQAMQILQQLADGVNPYTGERFPSDSPYQQADTVRALHLALEGLTKLRRATERKAGPGRPRGHRGQPLKNNYWQAGGRVGVIREKRNLRVTAAFISLRIGTVVMPPSTAPCSTEAIWDGENRLIEVVSNGVIVVQNQYDFMSRRVAKVTAMGTNKFVYDGWLPVREQSASGGNATSNYYVWGLDLSQSIQGAGGIGGLLMATLDDEAYFPAYDANGNITQYTDTNGTVVVHYEYDPFGNVSARFGGIAADFAHRYSTKYTDDETGLVYYGYRFYSPTLGRWLSRDPIEEEGGANIYVFNLNNAIVNFDAFGLVCGSGVIGDILVPDFPYGFDFTAACKAHDDCYGDCSVCKSECDLRLLNIAKQWCEANTEDKYVKKCSYGSKGQLICTTYNARKKCNSTAELYYKAVKKYGKGPCEARGSNPKCCKEPSNYRCDC